MAIAYGSISEVGKVRSMNQDAVFADARGEMGIFLVADGMGGHCRGEIASNCVSEMLGGWWRRNYIANVKMDFQNLVTQLENLIQQINAVVYETYQKEGLKGGTTVSLLLIREKQYAVFTVGDSRIYKEQKRKLMQISVDDVWENLVENIGLDRKKLEADRRFGTLTQALGYDRQIIPRIRTDKVEKGSMFVMCSDGVYKYLPSEKLGKGVLKYLKRNDLSSALEWIKNEVNRAGAGDNFSCVLIRV